MSLSVDCLAASCSRNYVISVSTFRILLCAAASTSVTLSSTNLTHFHLVHFSPSLVLSSCLLRGRLFPQLTVVLPEFPQTIFCLCPILLNIISRCLALPFVSWDILSVIFPVATTCASILSFKETLTPPTVVVIS